MLDARLTELETLAASLKSDVKCLKSHDQDTELIDQYIQSAEKTVGSMITKLETALDRLSFDDSQGSEERENGQGDRGSEQDPVKELYIARLALALSVQSKGLSKLLLSKKTRNGELMMKSGCAEVYHY